MRRPLGIARAYQIASVGGERARARARARVAEL